MNAIAIDVVPSIIDKVLIPRDETRAPNEWTQRELELSNFGTQATSYFEYITFDEVFTTLSSELVRYVDLIDDTPSLPPIPLLGKVKLRVTNVRELAPPLD